MKVFFFVVGGGGGGLFFSALRNERALFERDMSGTCLIWRWCNHYDQFLKCHSFFWYSCTGIWATFPVDNQEKWFGIQKQMTNFEDSLEPDHHRCSPLLSKPKWIKDVSKGEGWESGLVLGPHSTICMVEGKQEAHVFCVCSRTGKGGVPDLLWSFAMWWYSHHLHMLPAWSWSCDQSHLRLQLPRDLAAGVNLLHLQEQNRIICFRGGRRQDVVNVLCTKPCKDEVFSCTCGQSWSADCLHHMAEQPTLSKNEATVCCSTLAVC